MERTSRGRGWERGTDGWAFRGSEGEVMLMSCRGGG